MWSTCSNGPMEGDGPVGFMHPLCALLTAPPHRKYLSACEV
ncbi:hypothetical protein SGM_6189 [Streptomyces griseoaurantiacus M045]|uniref:Uncharacterized protein n=1 Tax=Streptomyces griseoaurantiacus M045 TaxID=996637 RepID=F3NSS5_9ACTN|nr:hypothetical protein SGM_6189 [Streptomyces griseoaurantiacus M045]